MLAQQSGIRDGAEEVGVRGLWRKEKTPMLTHPLLPLKAAANFPCLSDHCRKRATLMSLTPLNESVVQHTR